MVVPHPITAEAGYVLRQSPVDDGGRIRSGSPIAGDPGKAPGGSAVPQILNRRVVVEIQAVDEFFAPKLASLCIADISVIHAEMVVLSVVGDLQEATHVLGPGAR